MGTPKEEVRKLLNQIPDDASFEDILYHTHHIQCEDLFMILWTFLSVASGLPPGRRDCANARVRPSPRRLRLRLNSAIVRS